MGPGIGFEQFKPPAEALKLLDAKLGPRWLGMDVGEQDGRYIGLYAPQMYPTSASRLEQYFNFQRHFQRMTDDLGNKVSALLSLNFGHYLLKEGVYTLLGAETAQGLPNSQVYYAFIRGAGKQYGVLWFGNASIYNRWGFKTYGGAGVDQFNYRYGPTQGTSLSLLKRLLYSGILYNCADRRFRERLFRGREALAHRPHPTGGGKMARNQRPARPDAHADRRDDRFLRRLDLSAALIHRRRLSRMGQPSLRAGRLLDRRRARPALPRIPELVVLPR